MARTGASAYVAYGMEATFGGGASKTRALGFDVRLSGWKVNPNLIPIPELNAVELNTFTNGQFDGAFSAEWILSNPWWLSLLYGAPHSTAGSPNVHIYPTDVGGAGVPKVVSTAAAEIGAGVETTPVVRTVVGLLLNSVTLSSSLNQTIKVRGDFVYGIPETVTSTLLASPPADGVTFPYTFAHGQLQFPNATIIAELDSIELTVSQNANLVYGHNSPNAVGAYRQQMVNTARFTSSMFDATQLNRVLTRVNNVVPTVATFTLTFTNGVAGAGERSITFTGTTIGIVDHTTDIAPVERLFDHISWQILNLTVTAKNGAATPP